MMADKDGWIEWTGGSSTPIKPGEHFAIRVISGFESDLDTYDGYRWTREGRDDDIIAYRVADPVAVVTESLHAQPEPDGFTHESPIRAFTTWSANGRYAIGKGFRPSLQHLTVYLDAMERLEGWSLLQVLEAASGSPSFVFRQKEPTA